MRKRRSSRPGHLLIWLASLSLVSCTVPLGPGYTIRKQTVDVHFRPATESPVSIEAHYVLVNAGNQPLASLDLRLPRSSVLHLVSPSIQWDGQPIPFDRHEDPAGDVVRLSLAEPWPAKQSHALTVKYDIAQGAPNTSQLDFVSDSFYLPPGDAVPSLLPPKGTFSSGGAPPKKWILTMRVPQDFLVHAPGHPKRQKRENAELRAEFEQRPGDLVPFVVAGRYYLWEYRESHHTVIFWKKTPPKPAELEPFARDVARIIQTYDSLFGPRAKHPQPIRIIDSPMPAKAWSGKIGYQPDGSARIEDGMYLTLPPPDFGFLYLSESGELVYAREMTFLWIADSLARTWLGYGSGPEFERQFPMKALPDYAVEMTRESLKGAKSRAEFIAARLREVPRDAKKEEKESERRSRDKSLLFFFGLEDQFGREHLHAALRNMVSARRGRGYDLNDLIAAVEAEAGKPVAPFVRLWLKHPGIPEEFRARYAAPAAPANAAPKENPQ